MVVSDLHPQPLEKATMNLHYSTKVKALDHFPLVMHENAENAAYDGYVSKPPGRTYPEPHQAKGLSRPSRPYIVSTMNCRTLNNPSAQSELDKLLKRFNISVTSIQEHRIMHEENDPEIKAQSIGSYKLFTSSAVKNNQGASTRGVGRYCSKNLPLIKPDVNN